MDAAEDERQLHAGQTLRPFVRATGPEVWNRFAAVNDEFVDIHMDDDAGRAAGFPGAIGMGNLQVAYLHNFLRSILPAGGRIARVSCRFRQPNLKGQSVRAGGRVSAVRAIETGRQVDLDVWVKTDSGAVLCSGEATVVVPDRSEGACL